MDVACEKCQGKFKIPDEKVPKGRAFSLTCPKCNNKILFDARPDTLSSSQETPAPFATPESDLGKIIFDEIASASYDASDKPFDFVEEGVETALLCESDPAIRAKIKKALDNMGYNTTEPESPKDVLKQMRFHVFDVVVVNERFGTPNPDMNNILKYLERLAMSTRRNIFVALVTDRFRTMDNMMEFNKSVNLIVNLKNIDEIEKILRKGVADNVAFYRVFKESLTKTGRV